ncbi:MAG: TIR domain-containing protein [Dehalococcoidales bacterium]|nr:TIR domain-containing protein [Dehalococcoidales bacterium]
MATPDRYHPKIFISYSQDSQKHIDRVLDFSSRLRSHGIDTVLDQYERSPAEGWPLWMEKNIRNSDFILAICTETYYRRVMGDESPGKGRGANWEGKLIRQYIYSEGTNIKFIPILFDNSDINHIPDHLRGATFYNIDTQEGYEKLYRCLTNQIITIPDIGELKALPVLDRKTDYRAHYPDVFNEENLIKNYLEMLVRKCNTLGGLDVGPRLTLERIYINRDLHTDKSATNKTTGEETICDDEMLAQKDPFILVSGNAGLGKTSLLKNLVLKECQKDINKLERFPIFVSLGVLGQQPKSYIKKATIGQIALDELSGSGNEEIIALIDRLVKERKLLVCLDGLDEVPNESSNDIKLWIDSLHNRLTNGQIIVTSRKYSDNISLERFRKYDIFELNDQLKEKFVYLWFGAIDEKGTETGRAQHFLTLVRKNNNFSRILGNPLFLAIICLNYEIKENIARNPAEMIELFVCHLLKEWDRKRGVRRITALMEEKPREEIPYFLELNVLDQVAFYLFERGITLIDERELYSIVRRVCRDEKLNFSEASVIHEISETSGIITVQQKQKYQFSHQLLYEFFVANSLYYRYRQKSTSKSVKVWIEKKGHNERNGNIMAFLNDLFEYKPEESN